MSRLQKHSQRFAAQKVKLVAIAAQSPKTLRALRKKWKLSYPLLSDTSLKLIRLFGVEHKGSKIALPAAFIIGPTGKIEWREVSSVRIRTSEARFHKLLAAVAAKYKQAPSKTQKRSAPQPRR